LSDSFLFWLFLIGADGSSRTSLPEAALDRIIQRLSQAICRAGGRGAMQQVTRSTRASLDAGDRSSWDDQDTDRDDDIRAADDAAKNPNAKNPV
jgi:hypothetical protein